MVEVSKRTIFGFTIEGMPRVVRRVLGGTSISERSISCFILRRTGEEVVRTTTGEINMRVRGFPVGLNRCTGASTTSIPVLLGRVGQSKGLGENRGVVLTKFKTKLA